MLEVTGPCCGPKNPILKSSEEPVDPNVIFMKKICRIALTLFAAAVSPFYFAVSCGVGCLIGLGYICKKILLAEKIPLGKESPQCGRGWLEDLTGIQCSPLVSAAATAVFIAGHMHHSPFYVMFCGVPIGFYYGMQLGICGSQVFQTVQARLAKKRCCAAAA